MKLVDAEQAKEALGFEKTSQFYDAVRRGHVPDGVVVRIGRRLRFDLEAAKEWAAKGGTPLEQQQPAARAQAA